MTKIIVLHRDHQLLSYLTEVLCLTNVKQNELVATSDQNAALDVMKQEGPQLLILGAFGSDDTRGVTEFITTARKKNPELVIATYSALPLPGSIDAFIEVLDPDATNFKLAILDFQSGTLRHRPNMEVMRYKIRK